MATIPTLPTCPPHHLPFKTGYERYTGRLLINSEQMASLGQGIRRGGASYSSVKGGEGEGETRGPSRIIPVPPTIQPDLNHHQYVTRFFFLLILAIVKAGIVLVTSLYEWGIYVSAVTFSVLVSVWEL